MAKFKEKEEDYLYFKILKKNACRFLVYQQYVKKSLEGNPLALRVYKIMMNHILKLKDGEKEEHYRKILEQITDDTISFFKKNKKTYFSFKISNPKNDDGSNGDDVPKFKMVGRSHELVSFDIMIKPVVRTAIETVQEGQGKEVCIKKCYKAIDDYTKDPRRKVLRKQYSHYIISALAGYVALQCGYSLGKILNSFNLENKKPTNAILFNEVKHYTNPLSTYPPEKKKNKRPSSKSKT